MASLDTIPVIDLALPDAEVAKRIHAACTSVGFFYIKNHGIEKAMIDKAFEEVRKFFDLPLEEKLKIVRNKHDRGYVPPFSETLDPKISKKGDSKERINFGLEDLEGVLPLRGPNQWPDDVLLPEFRATIESYFDQVYVLAQKRLTRLMALSLGLKATAFDRYVKDPAVVFHPLHYFADISEPEKGIFACGEHSDYGIVTILATNEIGGLQIKIDDAWLDVPYKEGMFIINIGDMVELLTNGVYKSTIHRVVNFHGKERYSVPFFLNPNMTVHIEPLPEFCKERDPQYGACYYGDYLCNKYTSTNVDYVGPANMEMEI